MGTRCCRQCASTQIASTASARTVAGLRDQAAKWAATVARGKDQRAHNQTEQVQDMQRGVCTDQQGGRVQLPPLPPAPRPQLLPWPPQQRPQRPQVGGSGPSSCPEAAPGFDAQPGKAPLGHSGYGVTARGDPRKCQAAACREVIWVTQRCNFCPEHCLLGSKCETAKHRKPLSPATGIQHQLQAFPGAPSGPFPPAIGIQHQLQAYPQPTPSLYQMLLHQLMHPGRSFSGMPVPSLNVTGPPKPLLAQRSWGAPLTGGPAAAPSPVNLDTGKRRPPCSEAPPSKFPIKVPPYRYPRWHVRSVSDVSMYRQCNYNGQVLQTPRPEP